MATGDWLTVNGGGTCAIVAGLDVPVQKDLSGSSLRFRKSLIIIIKSPASLFFLGGGGVIAG